MTFSHLPRALARTSAPSYGLRRVANSPRIPLHGARRPSITLNQPSIRWASTSSTSRTWGQWFRGGLVRVLLVGGVLYFYATTDVFDPQRNRNAHQPEPLILHVPDNAPTLESLAAERKARRAMEEELAAAAAKAEAEEISSSSAPAQAEGDLEEESGQGGAFNPETGEINWDCPCLGGMADGPCGENFKEAFSCFVFSKEEPKGMDCIDKFKAMQDCFREHPDVYGEELMDDEEAGEAPESAIGEQAVMNQRSGEPAVAEPTKGQQPVEQQTTKKQQTEGQDAAEQEPKVQLPPGREIEAALADEAAKRSHVEAESKDASMSPRSTISDAPGSNS